MTATVNCLIAVGSNLGDRLDHLRAGVAAIDALAEVRIAAVSALYETAPVGGPDRQGPYLNGALRAETTRDAGDLLAELHKIEAERNRVRRIRWGPRTLDLDLLVHGGTVSDTEELQVPHPRQHERRFVLVPVCDIAADVVHPVIGRSMASLLSDVVSADGDLTLVAQRWHRNSDEVDSRLHREIE
ncbi:MAG: 2-amino-4-hydroxy-6-hydroxymethyldihydropteridine diphosphokinase [Ilumatobacteraceae bacterium]|nr:2-amino-4-hydroxy-6-hydroxymethyldihydropteridine diphosphokinase [Ilumatobacteraceae bacterium]